jgi:hypothetical protein
MIDETIPAPDAVSPATPAAQAEIVQEAEQTTPPPAEKPAGTDEQQAASPETPEKTEPSQAESKRKARNRERWQEMKQKLAFAEAELNRVRSQREPDYSQIEDPNEELAIRTAHKVRQMNVGEQEQNLNVEKQQAERLMFEAWSEAVDQARVQIPDFDQVVNERTPIHTRAAPFLVESDKGPEIAYWLGKNPDAARDLYEKFESAPARALIELGRIEAQVSAPPRKTVSAAPKPAPIISGGSNPLQFDAQTAGVSDIAEQLKKAGVIR